MYDCDLNYEVELAVTDLEVRPYTPLFIEFLNRV
jgi:hypothetical protein